MSKRRFPPACRSSWRRFRPASRCSTVSRSAASFRGSDSDTVPGISRERRSSANSGATSKPTPRFGGRLINCLGIRRDESAARAKRVPWRRNERLSVAGREVFDWLPIFDLATEDVFRVIPRRGPVPALDLPPSVAMQLLLLRFSPRPKTCAGLTGVSPSEPADGEDTMGLGRLRSRPGPPRRPRARRNGPKPPCPRSGAAQGSG